jgi:TolB-like protein
MRVALFLACLLPALASSAAPAAPRRPKLAITELKVLYGDPQLEALLSEVALTEAAAFKQVDTVGRSDIQAMLGFEREKQMLGCSEDAGCLAEIGGALGVDFLLVGTVGRIGTLHRLDLKLVDAHKAKVVGRVGESIDGGAEQLVDAAQEGVRRLLTEIAPRDPGAPTTARARWPGYVTLGAGGLLLAAGTGAAIAAKNQYDQLKKSQNDVGYADTYVSRKAKIHQLSVTADVLLGAGLVTAGVGTWLWWRARPVERAQVTQFSLLPVIGDGTVGLLAAGRF